MENCQRCGAPIVEGQVECTACGAPVRGEELSTAEESRKCPSCGERGAAEAEACLACGHLHVAAQCAVHADREARGQCVICGRALCSECNRGEGAYHRCADHSDIAVMEGWAQLYSTSDEIEAQLIEGNLRAEGIDARMLSQKDHFTFTVDFGDLSPVRILVPAFRYQEAVRVMEEHMDEAGELVFACPSCGEPYDTGAEVCAACGAALSRAGSERL